jgi:hypothetical protein
MLTSEMKSGSVAILFISAMAFVAIFTSVTRAGEFDAREILLSQQHAHGEYSTEDKAQLEIQAETAAAEAQQKAGIMFAWSVGLHAATIGLLIIPTANFIESVALSYAGNGSLLSSRQKTENTCGTIPFPVSLSRRLRGLPAAH